MSVQAVAGQVGRGQAEEVRLDAAPAVPAAALLLSGLILGVMGDALLRVGGPPGLNLAVWVSSVALAAVVLHRRAGMKLDRERVAWLVVGGLFAAGLAWRDSPSLKLLAMGSATLAFALAAYRIAAAWVRRAGVFRYVRAWATGALHAWTAAAPALLEASRSARPSGVRAAGWRRTIAVIRGLAIATPLLLVFGALFMAADAVFEDMVLNVLRIDFERIASHVFLFSGTAWIATGYLRGFAMGTELPPLRELWRDRAVADLLPRRPTLGIVEVATVLGALDLLFLSFVIVQFRYLFGGDVLVQVTPDLTYAEYARRGFFELVFAVFLVVPLLLAADWLLKRRALRDEVVFRGLAGVQIGLVLTITASAFQRLNLYYESYGLTESRFYAVVLLLWIGAMLLWLGATVLRGRRDGFGFGALASGLSTLALLFVMNPDAIIARTNVARMAAAEAPVRFDAAYASSLSADAVPVLIQSLQALPADVQCPLARHMLQQWAPDGEHAIRNWNWSASRARDAVRQQESRLRLMVGPDQECATPIAGGDSA